MEFIGVLAIFAVIGINVCAFAIFVATESRVERRLDEAEQGDDENSVVEWGEEEAGIGIGESEKWNSAGHTSLTSCPE